MPHGNTQPPPIQKPQNSGDRCLPVRGKFNSTCDVFAGFNATVPGAFKGTFPCRIVLEDAITTVGPGAPPLSRYMTINAYQPVGAWTTPVFGMDPANADLIASPSGSAPRWWVLYTDVVVWHALTPYWRAYLVRLPFPGTGAGGGLVLGGHATVYPPMPALLGGGLVLGGHANVYPPSVAFVGGGLVLGGHATVYPPMPALLGGGMVLGGTATVVFTPGGPTIVVLDTYTAADGTVATSRSPDTGPAPTSTETHYLIESNKLTNVIVTHGGSPIYRPLVYASGVSDCSVSADIKPTVVGSPAFDTGALMFRYVDDNNMWVVQLIASSNINVISIVAGTITASNSFSHTTTGGNTYNVKVVLAGSNVQLIVDGVSLGSFGGATFNQTATHHGVAIDEANPGGSTTIDNFEVTT